MSQQFRNGGHHDGDVTISVRDSLRYAVINPPYCGKHCKATGENLPDKALERSRSGQTQKERDHRSMLLRISRRKAARNGWNWV